MPVAEVLDQIAAVADQIEGITLLGGEPFSHAVAAAEIAKFTQQQGLTVMIFTGHLLEDLRQSADANVLHLLHETDILVDGKYERDLPDTSRRWIGSTNQRIHFLTQKYSAEDNCWQQKDTLEIRLQGDEISINGFPANLAKPLWKGWKRKSLQQSNHES